ncbi:MAG: hypothetical protein LAO18_05150 [Acidobacteriia bacterium]|nr:hypothetical protein [Terriglobia bacterium]
MLHKCANPACPIPFRSLSVGKLSLLETDNFETMTSGTRGRRGRSLRRMERYWLCDGCSSVLTLAFERGKGMVTVPLPARHRSVPSVHLTEMQRTMTAYPGELKGAL